MTKLVTIYGGAGFVGRYIARRMAKEGWRVRVATRRPNEAMHVKPYGAVGQVEPVLCNIRNEDSVRSAMRGADAVINCVGLLTEDGKNSFAAVQEEGASRIARIAADLGVSRLVHLSALGADKDSGSEYSRTKAAGEAAILESFPTATLLRPSIIFGQEDDFFNRFAKMAKAAPVLPLVGADTKFQPVYVDDVAQAAVKAVLSDGYEGIYELGGSDVETFTELMQRMLKIIKRRSLIVNLPILAGRIMAFGFSSAQFLTLGIFKNTVLTSDQIENLLNDNVVTGDHGTLSDFDVEPTSMEVVLPEYLWVYRRNGQYSDIMESAKGLKG